MGVSHCLGGHVQAKESTTIESNASFDSIFNLLPTLSPLVGGDAEAMPEFLIWWKNHQRSQLERQATVS